LKNLLLYENRVQGFKKPDGIRYDEFVKSRRNPSYVIPAKAGIQYFKIFIIFLDPGACPGPDPGFAGVTTTYESIRYKGYGFFLNLEPF